jgi:hypothetical protein
MNDSVKCKDCGKPLDGLPPLSSGARARCPKCGSTRRAISTFVSDSVKHHDHFAVLKKRDGRPTGFSESRRLDGRAATADTAPDGSISFAILGSSPQGEEETLKVCSLLTQKLNSLGSNWGEPSSIDASVVDCRATDVNDPDHLLQVQVVRAIVDQAVWESLKKSPDEKPVRYQSDSNVSGLASELETAIKKKVNRVSPDARTGLTLALDATLLPAVAFDRVIVHFHQRYGAWVRSLGFQSIWLVGPVNELIRRLDQPDSDPNDR